MYMPNIIAIKKFNFLTFNAKKAFNYLKQAFIATLILRDFDLQSHIWIEADISGFIISKVLS